MRYGSSSTVWRGVSLSNAKPLPVLPMSIAPPSKSMKVAPGTLPDGQEGGACIAGSGVAREHVLDVHEQQLLMLLLVMAADLDDAFDALERFVGRSR